MNITHAKDETIQGDSLLAIFNRQEELMAKYHDIELKTGLLQTEDVPVNIHEQRGQARLKDFAWRFIEEIGEALDARHHKEHNQEELIDALHFLTEFTILAGKSRLINFLDSEQAEVEEDDDYMLTLCGYSATLINSMNDYDEKWVDKRLVTDVVEEMGMCCNTLKNKPWKQSMMLTDENEFNRRLIQVWVVFTALMLYSGLDVNTIPGTYLKKSQVNKFRQRSNY